MIHRRSLEDHGISFKDGYIETTTYGTLYLFS